MDRTKSKVVEHKMVKGEYFRIMGLGGVSAEIWTWDGKYVDPAKEYGYICRRLADGFETILFPTNYIIPVDPPEDM